MMYRHCTRKFSDVKCNITDQQERINLLRTYGQHLGENISGMITIATLFTARAMMAMQKVAGGTSKIVAEIVKAFPYTLMALILPLVVARITGNQ